MKLKNDNVDYKMSQELPLFPFLLLLLLWSILKIKATKKQKNDILFSQNFACLVLMMRRSRKTELENLNFWPGNF